jgi:hypothetical protein
MVDVAIGEIMLPLRMLLLIGSFVMVDVAVGEIMLPLRMLLLIGSFVWLLGGRILSHVAWQSTLKTCTKNLTSLRDNILVVQDCQTRNLLYTLPGLLHNWMSCLLLEMEH